MFGPFMISRTWQGMPWDRFFLVLIVIVLYLAWSWGGIYSSDPTYVPADAAELAPVDAIDAMMMDIEEPGYTVYHTRDLEQDGNNRNRLIIEYAVISDDKTDQRIYKWAWEVSIMLTYDRWCPEGERYEELLEECELIPITRNAKDLQETLDQYMALSVIK